MQNWVHLGWQVLPYDVHPQCLSHFREKVTDISVNISAETLPGPFSEGTAGVCSCHTQRAFVQCHGISTAVPPRNKCVPFSRCVFCLLEFNSKALKKWCRKRENSKMIYSLKLNKSVHLNLRISVLCSQRRFGKQQDSLLELDTSSRLHLNWCEILIFPSLHYRVIPQAWL